jgi:phage repressor protein C with HTH and peptisase S24 domain
MESAGFESQSALARASGVPQPTINRILKGVGKKGPEAHTLVLLAQACKVSFQWLHEGTGPVERTDAEKRPPLVGLLSVQPVSPVHPSRTQIPKVNLKLSAGITEFQVEPAHGDGGIWDVPTRWIEKNGFVPERLLAIEVKGGSMEPSLYDGDLVVINTADTKLVNGYVYALNYEGDAVIKRLIREAGQWYASSDNPAPRYGRRACRGNECLIVGRVVRRETDQI